MKKNLNKAVKTVIAALLVTGCALSAFASPRSYATAGLIKNDKDLLEDVNEWSSVDFEKYAVSANYNENYYDITGAFNVSDITIVPFFYGLIGLDKMASKATRTIKFDVIDNIPAGYTQNEALDITTTSHSIYIQPGVLVGLGDIGIKLYSTVTSSTTKDFYDPSSGNGASNTIISTYDEDGNELTKKAYTYDLGKKISNSSDTTLQAGYNFSAGDYDFYTSGGLGFYNSNSGLYAEVKEENIPAELDNTVTKAHYLNQQFTIVPMAGMYVTTNSDSLTQSFGGNLKSEISIYGSKYTDAFGKKQKVSSYTGKTVVKTAKDESATTTNSTVVSGDVSDKSGFDFDCDLFYKVKYALSDQLTLAASAGITGNVSMSSNKTYSVETSKTEVADALANVVTTEISKTGASSLEKQFSMSIVPNAQLGLQYFIKPEKFAFNAGVSINSNGGYSYSSTKNSTPDYAKATTKVTDNKGNTITNEETITYAAQSDSKAVSSGWDATMTCGLYYGFTWIMNENFVIDIQSYLQHNAPIFGYGLSAGCTLKL